MIRCPTDCTMWPGADTRKVMLMGITFLGPVVQSIVSLMSSLRDQLVKCFTTLLPNTLKFFVEKAKASHVFSTKNIGIFEKITSENITNR